MKVLVINGPNLNMLGKREPEIYGNFSLDQIESFTVDRLKKDGDQVTMEWFQSNSEAELVEKIQASVNSDLDLVVINPAAFTHTSVSLLDALKMLSIPVVEVHLSNTINREDFRKTKITTKSSSAVIEGMGYIGYYLAIKGYLLKGK